MEIKKNEVFKKVAPFFPELKTIMEADNESLEAATPVPKESTSASVKIGPIKPTIQAKGMCVPQQKKLPEPSAQKPQIKILKNSVSGKKEEKTAKRSTTPNDS